MRTDLYRSVDENYYYYYYYSKKNVMFLLCQISKTSEWSQNRMNFLYANNNKNKYIILGRSNILFKSYTKSVTHRGTHSNVNDGICAESLHRVELQVTLEISGVKSGDGQPVTIASLRPRDKTRHQHRKNILIINIVYCACFNMPFKTAQSGNAIV